MLDYVDDDARMSAVEVMFFWPIWLARLIEGSIESGGTGEIGLAKRFFSPDDSRCC